MPGLRGSEKKRFFNTMSRWIVLACVLVGAILGYNQLGLLGLTLGLGLGLTAGSSLVAKERYFRR
jgi:hypothetical protein